VNYADLSETQAEALERTLSGEHLDQKESLSAMRELLNQLISTLNPREQIVIRLLDLEEKSVEEVSLLTEWGGSKIKVTAMRARRKLVLALQKLEPGNHP
jgi:RNA polymerase sigma-70 factor (ECF subfamily)